MADSPGSGSPLSSHASSEFMDEDVKQEEGEGGLGLDGTDSTGPPTKRQKLGSNPYAPNESYRTSAMDGEISSDTTGSPPTSPLMDPSLTNEDDELEQVTICRWRDCDAGDQGNMDELVRHIHEVHIPEKQKKWICEWEGCPRMDHQHASGYALRAHMRGHTKEKPFFCKLPECERSFTRSDALLKHMRTQHETEVFRQGAEAGVRNQLSSGAKPQRLKLIVKPNGVKENGNAEETAINVESERDFLLDMGLTEQDLNQPSDKLYRILWHHLKWNEEANAKYKAECKELEARQRQEWESKELIFSNVSESEVAMAEKRERGDGTMLVDKVKGELMPQTVHPISGSAWFRKK